MFSNRCTPPKGLFATKISVIAVKESCWAPSILGLIIFHGFVSALLLFTFFKRHQILWSLDVILIRSLPYIRVPR